MERMLLQTEDISTQSMQHLGLVASVIKKIGLVERIDGCLPLSESRGVKVTNGERVAAMILNGLGFVDERLYMFPEFLEDKPVTRLFREGVEASHFNDDSLGRCLDSIHEYGTTKLFSEMAFAIGSEFNLFGKTARLDTTSLSVYGSYEDGSDDFQINHGYSKDGKPDLKQMILTLATTGKSNLPMWMESHSGNASDKVTLQKTTARIKSFTEAFESTPSFMFVGDSAMYEACVKKGGNLFWLSRVPHTNKKSKEILRIRKEDLTWQICEKGYQISELRSGYGGIEQRWILVHSQQKHDRETITLNKRIAAEEEEISRQLWHLGNHTFACEKDAKEALYPLIKKLKYHKHTSHIEEVRQHKNKGRPKNGQNPEFVVGYKIIASITPDDDKISQYRQTLGRFILATNQLDKKELSNEDMLIEYKQQIHTEAGFRFIKNDAFEVSGVFLKKSTRVQALMMVMTLCLMVYNLAQHFLRESLETCNDTIPDQLKKPTKKPTMERICRMFRGVQVVLIRTDDYSQETLSNITPILGKIIRYYGPTAKRIYDLSG